MRKPRGKNVVRRNSHVVGPVTPEAIEPALLTTVFVDLVLCYQHAICHPTAS